MYSTFSYGFEYMGSTGAAPITPDSERDNFSLTSALQSRSCGLCVGNNVRIIVEILQVSVHLGNFSLILNLVGFFCVEELMRKLIDCYFD